MNVASVLALGVASIALLTDVRTRRIPNWLTGAALLGGVAVNFWLYGVEGVGLALLGAALGGLALFPFYLTRVLGAGDVKLLAGLGALIGPNAVIWVVLYGALVGGLVSAIILARRGRLLLTLDEMFVRRSAPTLSGATAPYALAIAGGLYLETVLPILWH